MNRIDKYDIDIRKISQYLVKYCDHIDEYYKWKDPSDSQLSRAKSSSLLSAEAIEKIKNTESYFQRNVVLKEEMYKVLNEVDLEMDIVDWIIRDWGGIRAKSLKSLDEFNSYLNDLKNNVKSDFKGIASFSKVASFMNPNKYIIYDSRVAYTLNWIMFKTNASQFYFPMPEGRNSKLVAFDIGVLIRLKNSRVYQVGSIDEIEKNYISKRDKEIYITKNEAYLTMCDVIAEINKLLFSNDPIKAYKPYYTEMLLFSLADTEVIKDITESISINVL